MKQFKISIYVMASILAGLVFVACNDDTSYSDLLRAEEKATNWYMANQRIELTVPADSVLEYGKDAPFYKMDEDGYIYLQVINPGTEEKAQAGDPVYFRFMRQNLKYLYADPENYTTWEGNADDLGSLGATKFIYGDLTITSSQTYGSGIQLPLKYVGYNSEVNIVLRSYYGFSSDQSQCLPYIYNVKYFKAEY